MRDKLLSLLAVPILVFPLLVIAAGGDLEVIRQELKAFSSGVLVASVQAGTASPTATVGPSPMVTIGPSPTVTFLPGPATPTPGAAVAPMLTRWGIISASIVLALIGLFGLQALRRNMAGGRRRE